MRTRHLIGLIASAGAMAITLAPNASADPTEIANPPACTSSGAVGETGTSTTECQTPGNVEISAAAPDVPTWSYPFDDGFYWSP